jgi:hypothetical protein
MSFYSGGVLTPLSLYLTGTFTPTLGNNPVNYVDYYTTGNDGGDNDVTYDFTNTYYWVEIQLHRQDTTVHAPIVYGVTLEISMDPCFG